MSAGDAWLFRGTERVPTLDVADRGLAYGDGLFETLRLHRGALPWWPAHRARLLAGAARLALPTPDADWLDAQVAAFTAAGEPDAVLKLQLTRGVGGRGYSPATATTPTLVLSRHALPAPTTAPLHVRWCTLRLSRQPALAGLKHLNRLEQVLARAECDAAGTDEGLLLDTHDRLVGAVSANVFVFRDGAWLTPPVDDAGIAGITRAWVLAHADARVQPLSIADVESADAVFLCNAVRGILPVGQLGAIRRAPHPALDDLRRQLGRQVPAFDSGS